MKIFIGHDIIKRFTLIWHKEIKKYSNNICRQRMNSVAIPNNSIYAFYAVYVSNTRNPHNLKSKSYGTKKTSL